MVSYWKGLSAAARQSGDWDESQRRLAFDLLRVRVELRPASDRLPPSGDTAGLAALAQREIDALEDRIADVLEPKHRTDQGMVTSGLALDEDATTRRLRRYESGFKNDFNKAEALFLKSRAESAAAANEAADALAEKLPPTSEAGYDYLSRQFEEYRRMSYMMRQQSDALDPGEDAGEAGPEAEEEADAAARVDLGSMTPNDASPAPRPLTRRARKEQARRLRAAAKAAREAARPAGSVR
jgi:hypothetical protein